MTDDLDALRAENADLRALVATLRRVNGYLRADVAALGQRRATIRREAERDVLRALGESEHAVTGYAQTVTHGKIGDNGTARRANAEPPLSTAPPVTQPRGDSGMFATITAPCAPGPQPRSMPADGGVL